MDRQIIHDLVDRYSEVYFFGAKRVAALISEQILEKVTPEQLAVLTYLAKNAPCLTSQISDYCGVNPGATTAMLNRLVGKGYTERNLAENDRRVVLVNITDKGREMVKAGYDGAYKLVESLEGQFDQAEIETFVRVFEKLVAVFQAKEEG